MNSSDDISKKIKSFHEQATTFAHCDDFGSTDDNYLENLKFYLSAVGNEAVLSEIGKAKLGQTVIDNLVARLYAKKGLVQYPECLDQPIVKPIIVVGLPRSGTTALHKLLASAPDTQSLEYWLAMFPMPRPSRETWNNTKEFRQVDGTLTDVNERSPDLKKAHHYGAEIPDECNRIICHSFASWSLQAFAFTRTFGKWVLSQNLTNAYERYKQILQLIGYKNHSRWVLKDPLHLPYIDLLMKLFPDACLVHISREPSQSMPSVCSGIYAFLSPYQPNIEKREFGKQVAEEYALMTDRFMELRDQLNSNQFLDVSYSDLITDPVSLAKKIYRHFDIDVGAEGEACFERWRQENKRDKYGRHIYTAEEYGLSRETLNDRFGEFRKRYLHQD